MEASALAHPVGLGRVSLAGPLLRLRTDEQLVALFRAGHDEAFQTIHDRYRARLFAYARQMLGGSQSDAEDVLQDVFLRAYNALRVDGRDVALRAWLYRVAHNRCIDQLRRPAPAAEDIYDINRGVSTDLLAEAERREDLRRLIADVRGLPEQQRSALLMREMEGLSYNDLAAALGVTVPAVKSLLVRARVGLVEAIEARDTACVEIRHDLASAFDRGVRPSGRAKRHLRDCTGCREYRGALRGLDKSLNGLALPTGPLTTLMKVLGIGGAGSGAAAGGGAAVVGGGGAAAGGGAVVAGGAGVATTVSSGVIAATATKVAAVVAAAAVVGGGAAVEQHHTTTRHHAAAAPVAHVAVAPQRREDLTDATAARVSRAALAGRQHGVKRAAAGSTQVTKLQAGDDRATASAGSVAVADQTTGGTTAPDDAAPDPTTGDGTTTTWSGSGEDTAATGTNAGDTTQDSGAGSSSATGTSTSSGTTSSSGTTTATQASGTSSTTTASASSGTGTGTGGTASPPASGTTQASTPPASATPAG